MRRSFIVIPFAVLLLLSSSSLVYGDRGMIPIVPEVSVYEPGQKAIIAWNGTEEILILSTDVTSSEETLVLEMLPLPSNPEKIELASFESFQEVQSLIWKHMPTPTPGEFGKEGVRDVEVVFHEKIGAHDITVVRASDTSEIVEWMRKFLGENDVDQEFSLGNFEFVVRDYMARGFRFYVLDLIEVSPEQNSVEPILYKFETSFLYYPVEITSPLGGETKITLFLLTDGVIEDDYHSFRKANYQTPEGLETIEFKLSKGELSKIDLRIKEMFQGDVWLTALSYEGSLNALTRDLKISEEAITPARDIINVEVVMPFNLAILLVTTGMMCTLVGVVSMFLIMRSKWRTKTHKK